MNSRPTNACDLSELEAGSLLPGCSIPVRAEDTAAVHAFRSFVPLNIEGLNAAGRRGLVDSMVDVARSIDLLHASGCSVGQIRSDRLHDRGTKGSPRATLWFDPRKSTSSPIETDDPRAMYWSSARHASGGDPSPADDWYAFGIVLAEIAMSPGDVYTIYELSQNDGDFADRLAKNLRKTRADRGLKRLATRLIREGAAGQVDPSTIHLATTERPRSQVNFVAAVACTLSALALGFAVAWQVQTSRMRNHLEERIAMLEAESEEKESDRRRPEPVSQQAASRTDEKETTPSPTADPTPVAKSPIEIWQANVSGRSLEEALRSVDEDTPEDWRQTLIELSKIPGQTQWRRHDRKLRQLVQQSVNAPWDDNVLSETLERFQSLQSAYDRWETWSRSDRSVEEIRAEYEAMPTGVEKGLLGRWLGDVGNVKSFELRVTQAAPTEDNPWVAHLLGIETAAQKLTEKWQWDAADGDRAAITLTLDDYRPGLPISVWLQRDSSIPFWNQTVIEHTMTSPLLAWRLAKGLRLSDRESGYAIRLLAKIDAGPPARLDSAAESDSSSAGANAGTQKPVVDPMDALPFSVE